MYVCMYLVEEGQEAARNDSSPAHDLGMLRSLHVQRHAQLFSSLEPVCVYILYIYIYCVCVYIYIYIYMRTDKHMNKHSCVCTHRFHVTELDANMPEYLPAYIDTHTHKTQHPRGCTYEPWLHISLICT